ncbi:ATPase 5, plasma membrane-type [Glycine soja]|uniref:ATPase 5, plasma membrane-type n=1 Tax=Glycine soja TaxID=3848 RepID=A0A0B2QPM4_GLYSO|nr:ATPase 5, plasma membrane-type [Glycine soja]
MSQCSSSLVQVSNLELDRMKNYIIYVVSITIRIVFGFMFIALIGNLTSHP